jgi:uncharacterized membrane protein (DUF4010 family)
MGEIEILERLAVSLAVGLVIGLERGWTEREAPEGTRVAGLRTFALIGLAGGTAAVLGIELGALVAAAIALGLAALLYAIRSARPQRRDEVGATTEVAVIAAFALAMLAGVGRPIAALGGAVVAAFLLGAKPMLHGWLRGIEERELFAALQLLLIAAVILPIVPDRDMGPYGALNPFRIWWMVVLIAGVSFAGYLAMRLLGARLGVLLNGVAGGLVSSTATTLQLSRGARDLAPALHRTVTAAILAACSVMVVRVVAFATAIHPPLLAGLIAPFGAALIVGAAATAWCWSSGRSGKKPVPASAPRNPLDLRVALGFAIMLAVVMLLAEAGQDRFGASGLFAVAAFSGLADVDAITLSVATKASHGLAVDIAAIAIAIASGVDTVVKAGLAIVFGPRTVGWPVASALLAQVAAGGAALAMV